MYLSSRQIQRSDLYAIEKFHSDLIGLSAVLIYLFFLTVLHIRNRLCFRECRTNCFVCYASPCVLCPVNTGFSIG